MQAGKKTPIATSPDTVATRNAFREEKKNIKPNGKITRKTKKSVSLTSNRFYIFLQRWFHRLLYEAVYLLNKLGSRITVSEGITEPVSVSVNLPGKTPSASPARKGSMDLEKKTVVSLTKQMAALVAASAEPSYLPHLAPDVTTPDSATRCHMSSLLYGHLLSTKSRHTVLSVCSFRFCRALQGHNQVFIMARACAKSQLPPPLHLWYKRSQSFWTNWNVQIV